MKQPPLPTGGGGNSTAVFLLCTLLGQENETTLTDKTVTWGYRSGPATPGNRNSIVTIMLLRFWEKLAFLLTPLPDNIRAKLTS